MWHLRVFKHLFLCVHVSAGSAVPWCFVEVRSTSSGISFDFHLWNRVSSFDTAYSGLQPSKDSPVPAFHLGEGGALRLQTCLAMGGWDLNLDPYTCVTFSQTFLFFASITCIYSVCGCAFAHPCAHVWMYGTRGQLLELILSLYHVGSGDWIQMIKFGSIPPYPLNHLAGPSS